MARSDENKLKRERKFIYPGFPNISSFAQKNRPGGRRPSISGLAVSPPSAVAQQQPSAAVPREPRSRAPVPPSRRIGLVSLCVDPSHHGDPGLGTPNPPDVI